jgi:uncharacterized membrane protein YkoI
MKRTQKLVPLLGVAALVFGLAAALLAGERQIERKEVPAAVLAAFAGAYPKATIKGYSTEEENGQTVYEIESVEGLVTRDVTYTADGAVVSLEETLETGALPRGVKSALKKNFPTGKVLKAERITKGTTVTYEFQIEDKGQKFEVVFDPKGNELERETKPEDVG